MRGLLAFLTPFFFIFSAFADAPESGILDRAQILPLPISKALERVLHEHRRATQDTIFLITEAKSPENGIDAEAGARLEEWRGSTPRPPNVVVIAVDAEEGNLAIRAGLGLDTTIGAGTDRAKEIRRVYFAPEWKVGNKHRALVLSTLEVLRALESPVVLSGEATDALERAGFSGGWTPEPITAKTSTTWIRGLDSGTHHGEDFDDLDRFRLRLLGFRVRPISDSRRRNPYDG